MGDSRWGLGYITDAHYAQTYFRELSPAWMNYVAAWHGIRGPSLDRPFAYLELGCGFGQSTTVHAASFPGAAFFGCDFNATHVQSADAYAHACGVGNVRFTDASFERLPLDEFPATFDFIALHGVYSWVDAVDRQTIRQILSQRLRPGGLAYLSYNCLPGWTAEVPLRRLMRELATAGSGDTAERTRDAIRQLGVFADVPFRFFKVHPAATEAVESYARGQHEYIAHEFLNEAWEPFYSIDVADDMASSGLQYVGSGTLADNHPVLIVDERVANACAALPSARLQELAFDFATNRRFRRDVFVKSQGQATAGDAYLEAIVGSIEDPVSLDAKARVPRGDIRFQETFINDVRTLVAGGAFSIRDMLATLGRRTSDRPEIVRNIALLVAAGTLAPFARVEQVAPAENQSLSRDVATRILRQIAADGQPRAVPGHALGYGLVTSPSDAKAALECLDGGRSANDHGRRIVQRLQRIGALG